MAFILYEYKPDNRTLSTYNQLKWEPLYGKRVKYSKKFRAHDELNTAKEGDIVEIMETRPLSATKRYRLVKIVQEAVII